MATICRTTLAATDDILIADFDGADYGAWKVTGDAFGTGPATGPLPGQMDVSGFIGHGYVNSFHGGDGSTGTLTSPEFKIQRPYINFLIGGGAQPGETCINLVIDGKIVRTATGPNDKPGGTERLDWYTWDVTPLVGQTAIIEIVDKATGGWGHINIDQISQSSTKAAIAIKTDVLYDETYRPQFHFTAKSGWLNDPNGLVYFDGEYHLFFQHNPFGTEWGNMTWGHAVSRDLVHWEQLANALEPDASGTMFSGSAVVDRGNTTGFGIGSQPLLIAMYTAAGDTSPASKGQPFTQCIAYSNDKGRTFTKFAGNPVLKHIIGGNRDPKLAWFAPTHSWTLALYLDGENYGLFTSPNLKDWKQIQTVAMPGSSECPDFFEIPIEGEHGAKRWVLTGANGHYLVGAYDGAKFTPENAPRQVDFGGNYYAVQSYSDIPAKDGRRIQIAWMNGGSYPGMPFNQQMSFPCRLTLRRTADGLRLYRWPVDSIHTLSGRSSGGDNIEVSADKAYSLTEGELLDIEADFKVGDAKKFGLLIHGSKVEYSVDDKTLSALGHTAPLEPEDGVVHVRVLVDRTSLEVFGNKGRVSLTSCFLPRPTDIGVAIYAEGGAVTVSSVKVSHLHSAWK